MTVTDWALLVPGAAIAAGYAFWWYRSREQRVPGLSAAATLRAVALIVAWTLLVNPPWRNPWSAPRQATAVLLDASYSMDRPSAPGGRSVWAMAVDSARSAGHVWVFGGDVARRVSVDSLPATPSEADSRLEPALRAAAAAGARRVVVLTDGDLVDLPTALTAARQLNLSVRFVRVAMADRGVGIASMEGPSWVQAGDTLRLRAEIVAAGVELDSVRVEAVDSAGYVVATREVAVPAPGRFSPVELAFPIESGAGFRRYVVRLGGAAVDPERRDDARSLYVHVTDRPRSPVLISLAPDWEPSFLVSTLDRLTDVPARVYVEMNDGLVSVRDDYRPVALATVLRHARSAPLLVLHAYGADAPGWARDLVRRAERLLVLAAGDRPFNLPDWGVSLGAAATGEWYLSDQVPASPLSLELPTPEGEELPPLRNLRLVRASNDWSPLVVRRARRGTPVPAVVAGRLGDRRWVVGPADGYWRWAFRPGPGREVYQALWGGVTGWLVKGRSRAVEGLEPERHVVSRGEGLRWIVPAKADSARIRVDSLDGGSLWEGGAGAGDTVEVRLPAGRYQYTARVFTSEGGTAATGPAEVEAFAPELLPRAPIEGLDSTVQAGPPNAAAAQKGQGLATFGWPYLLLILLLCAEWAVRRYIGLR